MSHTIASSIEFQTSEAGGRIVIRRPGHTTASLLLPWSDRTPATPTDILEAVRMAYQQGRLDSRQEVSMVMRGVLGL